MAGKRVALVTAATEGIGYAIARRLAQDGAHVVLSSRRQENVDRAVSTLTAEGLSVSGRVCHVGKPEHRKALVDDTVARYGKIDVFVSNAAVNPTTETIREMASQAVDKLVDINIKSAIFLYQLVAPHMREGGSIVFISSVTAYSPSLPLNLYATCKTALLGLTKAVAQEMAEVGVRVNCVAPGFVPTKFSSALTATEEMTDMLKGQTMLKRLGTSEEIAGAVAFLTSADASYVTGETLVVSGGMQSKL
ncbi:glucose/ribitol dehydrogenase [Chloropicon primus]|uniref:Glucose/ribitol dehydrogenase n=1 Tax=Chloropicon primus TaxID=1764295 RepID=A0A5B8ML35_9CHLO|nr:glucose/ribitol dehydrogenase [Chloropicon primus]UPQ99294.1 glucose/ribitol dehydrogenase [Chloropicon primus]|mmetsp:Transcript_8834/g.25207  ORF Transcript_8834/g.25207 Transcript_8834/m.25207 type:complete len:249 (-) Transcript_8834:1046-1792(-)|eukprot:QDZ20082.1 glucose/ribitol dehydrogenase [Chloropicon primus]